MTNTETPKPTCRVHGQGAKPTHLDPQFGPVCTTCAEARGLTNADKLTGR